MTFAHAEKGFSETTVPDHQTTSFSDVVWWNSVFLNCLHRYENHKLYKAPNVKLFLLLENINTETETQNTII